MSDESEVRSVVDHSLLHLEAVRVSVEGKVVVEVLELPVDHDFFAKSLKFTDGNSVQLNLKLDIGLTREQANKRREHFICLSVAVVQGNGLDTCGFGFISLVLDEG